MKLMENLRKSGDEEYHESMVNSYVLLTGKLSWQELFDHNECSLPFSVEKKIDNEVIDKIIDYFCTLEEYEKCGELKKLKESKKYKKNFINL
jgi:hypothetical protein